MAVLGVGEEEGEVRRGLGVWMVASGLLRGVGVGEAKAAALRGLWRGRASSLAGPRREKDVNKMREFTVARLMKEQGLGVVYWQRNAPARSVRPARSKRRLRAVGAAVKKRDSEIDRGEPGAFIGEGRACGCRG